MSFGRKWRHWIHGCLSSSTASILVNGTPKEEFPISCGVRQGDLLSPFLFILAMEGLHVAVRETCINPVIQGVKLLHEVPTISHLLYADDVIFVGSWDISGIQNLSRIHKCFPISSSLKVNFHKSFLFGIGISDMELQSMARAIGCLRSQFPFTYLGVPVGANMLLKKNWEPVLKKFQSKLSSWKANTLSFFGRLMLVKSVLGSLPTYYLSLFKAPQGILDYLEKLRHRFLWGGTKWNK